MSYINTILVTLIPSSPDFIVLQTYDYEHGKSQRFYIHHADLEQLISHQPSLPLLDADLNSFLQIYRDRDHLHFKTTWLSVNWLGQASGYVQWFDLPVSCCAYALHGFPMKKAVFITEEKPKASLHFTPEGHQEIRRLCADKLTRRALCKFFRDHMNYGADEVLNITRDNWVDGLYFFSPVTGYEGGIVRHNTELKGSNGKSYPKVFFGLHT